MAQPVVVLLILDGCRADALDGDGLPNLSALREKSLFCRRARTIFPSATGPAHTSILTGAYPERTGLTGHFTFDRGERRLHDLQGRRYAEAEFLPEALAARGQKTLCVGPRVAWRGSEAGGRLRSLARRIADRVTTNQGIMRSRVLFPLLRRLRFNYRVLNYLRGSFDAFLDDLQRGGHDFYYVVLPEPDKKGHVFGPLSEEYREAVREADLKVGRIVDVYRRIPREGWLLIGADHGHTPISRKAPIAGFTFGVLGLPEPRVERHPIGRELRIATYDAGGPREIVAVFCTRHIQAWCRERADALRIAAWLRESPDVARVFAFEEQAEIRIIHPRAPDLTAVLADGVGFDANDWKGDHGGWNADDVEVPFLVHGPGTAGREISGAHVVDLAPTAAAIFRVPPPAGAQGKAWVDVS